MIQQSHCWAPLKTWLFFSHQLKWKSLSRVWLFATAWAIQSMEFSSSEYWVFFPSGYPFPSPGDLPNPGIEPRSSALQEESLPAKPQGKPFSVVKLCPTLFSNSCPFSWWCHPTISSSAAPFSFCLLSFPKSGSFPMSWLLASGGQTIGASASVFSMNIQEIQFSFRNDCFYLFAVQRTLKRLLQHHNSKPSILWHTPFLMIQLSHPYMTIGKTIALTIWTFVGKVIAVWQSVGNFAVGKVICFFIAV